MKTQQATTKAKKQAKNNKKAANAAKKATKQAKEARAGSKKEIVLKLLRNSTLAAITDLNLIKSLLKLDAFSTKHHAYLYQSL